MYRITMFDNPTDTTGTILYDPRTRKSTIESASLNLKENEVDDFTMTVGEACPAFNNVWPMFTHIEIRQDGGLIFRGRALKPTKKMGNNGMHTQDVTFESIGGYLIDTTVEFHEFNNISPADAFRWIINNHNIQIEDYKKFTIGKIDVTNSTNNIYCFGDYQTTWDTIKDKLLATCGGFIKVRYVNNVNYIDWLQDPGKDHPSDTPIQVSKNMKSASLEIDPTQVISRFVPLGSTIQQEDSNKDGNKDGNKDVATPRVGIKSVNNGLTYIVIPEFQKEFGTIVGFHTWDDVNDPNILLSKAKDWINNQLPETDSWTVDVLELPGNEYGSFRVSDRYNFVNSEIAQRQLLRVTEKTINFSDPYKVTLTIGTKNRSLSDYQVQMKLQEENLKDTRNNASSMAELNYGVITKKVGDVND